MTLDITKQKEKAIAIMKRMDIYTPYITGFQEQHNVCYFEEYGGYWVCRTYNLCSVARCNGVRCATASFNLLKIACRAASSSSRVRTSMLVLSSSNSCPASVTASNDTVCHLYRDLLPVRILVVNVLHSKFLRCEFENSQSDEFRRNKKSPTAVGPN